MLEEGKPGILPELQCSRWHAPEGIYTFQDTNSAHYLRDCGTIGIPSKRASLRCDRSQLILYIVRHSLCRELLGLRGFFPDEPAQSSILDSVYSMSRRFHDKDQNGR